MVVLSLTNWMLSEKRDEHRSTLGNVQQIVMILDADKKQTKLSVWLKNSYQENKKMTT